MSAAIQKRGIVERLFSSALFCLWLSTASLVVWLDLGSATDSHTVSAPAPRPASAASGDATRVPDNRPDAA